MQLTNYAEQTVGRNYGQKVSRTLMVGGSNGGHHTKWMVEDYPSLYDGGLSRYGFNSQLEQWGGDATVLRNYDVIAPRIQNIINARTADPNWDPGSEFMWRSQYNALLGYLSDSMPRFDRTYDPNGDGVLTDDELKQWNPHLSPVEIQNDLRKLDLTGNLQRPIIIGHSTFDPIVSPNETVGYKRLVETRLGVAGAREVLAVYFIPGMGHGGAEFNAFLDPPSTRSSGGSTTTTATARPEPLRPTSWVVIPETREHHEGLQG